MNEIIQLTVTDSGSEPLTLQQAKDFLQELSSDRDDEITDLITVARERLEQYTGYSLIDKDIELIVQLDAKIRLPYPKLDAITTFERWNGTGWETYDYYENIGDFIYPQFKCEKVKIEYSTTAVSKAGVTQDLKRVLLWLYENKGDNDNEMPVELFSNADKHRILSWE